MSKRRSMTTRRVGYYGCPIRQTRQIGESCREAEFGIATLRCGKFTVAASIQVENLARIM